MADTDKVIRVFSEDHVVILTGLSKGQLRSWDRSEFFTPHYAYEDRHAAYSRIYSFRDVVGLRTITMLMKDYHVSLPQLRRVANELTKRGYEHWADMKLYVVKREVHFQEPESERVEGVWSGQTAMLPVIDVINDMSDKVAQLQRRSTDQYGKIEQHRFVARNTPVVAGTRIPTATIRRYSEAGYSLEQILQEYPTLTREDIEAALTHEGLAHTA